MPAFATTLSAAEIGAIAELLPAREADRAPEDEEAPAAAEAPAREFDAVPGVHDTLDYAVRVELFADGLETVWSMAFLDADTVFVDYSLRSLLSSRIYISELRLARPVIVLDRPPEFQPASFAAPFRSRLHHEPSRTLRN